LVFQEITTALAQAWTNNITGVADDGARATTIEPAKSMGSPGVVGSRMAGQSHCDLSGVSGMIHSPFVPKIVPAPTRALVMGDQSSANRGSRAAGSIAVIANPVRSAAPADDGAGPVGGVVRAAVHGGVGVARHVVEAASNRGELSPSRVTKATADG
jgi:hypothetical protein